MTWLVSKWLGIHFLCYRISCWIKQIYCGMIWVKPPIKNVWIWCGDMRDNKNKNGKFVYNWNRYADTFYLLWVTEQQGIAKTKISLQLWPNILLAFSCNSYNFIKHEKSRYNILSSFLSTIHQQKCDCCWICATFFDAHVHFIACVVYS